MGSAIIVTASQTAFTNRLGSYITSMNPQIDRQALIVSGATSIRTAFPTDEIPVVIGGYMAGIKLVFAVYVGAMGLAFLIALWSPWKRISQENAKHMNTTV